MRFDDMGATNGISQANAQYVSWGSGVYDFDNDGKLDILIFHGGLIHMIPQEHTLFRGLGNGKFEDVSRHAGPVLSTRTVARGACFADYNNDGKVDAFVVNLGARGTLLHNVSTDTGHWIDDQARGAMHPANGTPPAIATASARALRSSLAAASGRGARGRIGLSFAERWPRCTSVWARQQQVDKIIVHWPSGREQTLENLSVDRVLTIEEPK